MTLGPWISVAFIPSYILSKDNILLLCFGAVEKILSLGRVAVVMVLDFVPGRGVWRVPAVCLLRDNPRHVAVANHLEQVSAARYVIH